MLHRHLEAVLCTIPTSFTSPLTSPLTMNQESTPNLNTLPVEVHVLLAEFLPVSAITTLSKTSSQLCAIYNPISWRSCFVFEGKKQHPPSTVKSICRNLPFKVFVQSGCYATWFLRGSVIRVFIHRLRSLEDFTQRQTQFDLLEDYPALISTQPNVTDFKFSRFINTRTYTSLAKAFERNPQFSFSLRFQGSLGYLSAFDFSSFTSFESLADTKYFLSVLDEENFKRPEKKIRLPNLKLIIDSINGRKQRYLIYSLRDCCNSGKLKFIQCSLEISKAHTRRVIYKQLTTYRSWRSSMAQKPSWL